MSLSKTQRLKLELERRGLSFPMEVNMGMYNHHNNVYRARLSLKTAQKALKERKLEEVMDECKRALFLLSVDRVQNPLVEIDVTSSITALVMEVSKTSIRNFFLYNLRNYFLRLRSSKALPLPARSRTTGPRPSWTTT